MCVERTLEKVTFIACLDLVGGNSRKSGRIWLESINDIAMYDLCVHMYVSSKTGKTKLLLIRHHRPHSCP